MDSPALLARRPGLALDHTHYPLEVGPVVIAEANEAADAAQYGPAARLAAEAAGTEPSPADRASIVQWQLRWSVQAGDAGLTRTARRDLRAALAAIPDEQQWIQSAYESSLFLADAGLHQDAHDLNVQLAEHEDARAARASSGRTGAGSGHLSPGTVDAIIRRQAVAALPCRLSSAEAGRPGHWNPDRRKRLPRRGGLLLPG